MTKVSASYEKILNFRRAYEEYTRTRVGQFRPFLYALGKMYARLKPFEDEYADRKREIEIDLCHKDSKGFAELEKFTVERKGEKREEERMKFSAENQKQLQKKYRELLNAVVEVEPYLAVEDVPDDLGFDWWGLFSPFVLPDDVEEGTLDKLYQTTKDKVAEHKKRLEEEREARLEGKIR